jgi:hypothetical protein
MHRTARLRRTHRHVSASDAVGGAEMSRLPGAFIMYDTASIAAALNAFADKHDYSPECVAVHTSYRLSDADTMLLIDADAQLVQVHTVGIGIVYVGPVGE